MTEHIQIGDVSPRIRYVADGVTVDFTYPFPIFDAADLDVFVDAVLQTLSTDYTVAGAGVSAGGTVSFVTAPANGVSVTLVRRLAIKRTSDFQASGEFRAKVINDELDFQTAALQQVEGDQARSLRLSRFDDAAALELPAEAIRASKVLAFDADGNVTVSTESLTEIEGAATSAAAALLSEQSAANSAATAVTVVATAEQINNAATSYDIGFNTGLISGAAADVAVGVHGEILLPRNITIQNVKAHAQTAPTGAAIIFDIKKNGVSIFSILPEIDAGTTVEDGNHVLSATTAVAGDVMTFEITQVGSTLAGSRVKVTLQCNLTNVGGAAVVGDGEFNNVTANGEIFFDLPTTPGAVGSLWNDAGTVKVA